MSSSDEEIEPILKKRVAPRKISEALATNSNREYIFRSPSIQNWNHKRQHRERGGENKKN